MARRRTRSMMGRSAIVARIAACLAPQRTAHPANHPPLLGQQGMVGLAGRLTASFGHARHRCS